jgi:hypothetical protein
VMGRHYGEGRLEALYHREVHLPSAFPRIKNQITGTHSAYQKLTRVLSGGGGIDLPSI